MGGVTAAPSPTSAAASRLPGAAFIFKKALISALVALVLFSLMIGIRTEAAPSGQLIYWTRFGDLAAMVATVFGGSIVVELLRQWWGPVGTIRVIPPSIQSGLAMAGRGVAPVLLIFTFLVPVIFYDQRYILDLGILVLTYVMLGWGLNVVVGLFLGRVQGRRRVLDPDHRADFPAHRPARPARSRKSMTGPA